MWDLITYPNRTWALLKLFPVSTPAHCREQRPRTHLQTWGHLRRSLTCAIIIMRQVSVIWADFMFHVFREIRIFACFSLLRISWILWQYIAWEDINVLFISWQWQCPFNVSGSMRPLWTIWRTIFMTLLDFDMIFASTGWNTLICQVFVY